ncbi:Hcp family type VI secretion system effector [Massilia timonae]|uniref:Hcp family type VI secretion system effector n=1 Tax=Massilia timonae TaxID=47229 RepID=UPI0028D5C87A|nr:type VI secretion system tube protein Hcp [Massilia timonae]
MEVSKVQYSIFQPRAEVVSTGGGHTSGRADLFPITFKKLADISSPVLLQTCAAGKTIPKATFEFLRADGNGNPVPYFRIDLENLLISSITPDSGDGGIITERVQLAFSKVQWKYVRQSIRGGTQGNSTGGWNCSTNRVC